MSKHLKTYIGGQVKTLRKQSGLTQADLGEQIGRTAEAISNVETGKSLPSLDTLIAVAEALGVPLTGTVRQNLVEEGRWFT